MTNIVSPHFCPYPKIIQAQQPKQKLYIHSVVEYYNSEIHEYSSNLPHISEQLNYEDMQIFYISVHAVSIRGFGFSLLHYSNVAVGITCTL